MPKDKTATTSRIVQAMKEEFLSYGYEKASLNRISARVGITTAALYRHFKGKEDMFRSLVQDTLDDYDRICGEAEAGMEQARDYDPFDHDWVRTWTDFIYSHFEGMKLLLCCSEGSPFASFEEEMIEREAAGNRRYMEILRLQGKPARPITDMQWHILSTAYVHLIAEVVRHDMDREEAQAHLQFVGDLLYPGWRKIFGLRSE